MQIHQVTQLLANEGEQPVVNVATNLRNVGERTSLLARAQVVLAERIESAISQHARRAAQAGPVAERRPQQVRSHLGAIENGTKDLVIELGLRHGGYRGFVSG